MTAAGQDPTDDGAVFNNMIDADGIAQGVTEFIGDNLFARQPFVGTIAG